MRASDRLLELLEVLGKAHGQTLTRLSQQLELPKPTVLRLLRALEERGWVVRLPEGGYGLGPRFVVVAQQSVGSDSVLSRAPEHMARLRDELDETVSLLTITGMNRVCLLEFPSRQPLRYVHAVGSEGPLYAGASGKALLAFGPPELRQAVVNGELPRFTSKTITSAGELDAELDRIGKRGWAMSQGERSQGSVALAVPLRDALHGAVYSLTVFAPRVRFRSSRREAWVARIHACARAIEAAAAPASDVLHSA